MKQFFIRLANFLLIGFIPVIILISTYLYFDPFKVIRSYSDYSYPYVIPNRDYISTTMFVKNYKKYNYNSFIFGSSRTLAFKPKSWCRYLSPDDKPYMFDASCESIYGIYTKIKYLDSINVKIKNALIILCTDHAFKYSGNHSGHLFIKHPLTSGESKLTFQLEFFKAYLVPKFLFNFYSYKIIGTYRPFMSGYIEDGKITYDTITNETNYIDQQTELARNPTEYYAKRKDMFREKKSEETDVYVRINERHLYMIKEIKRILGKNNTNYKVVISPLFDQVKFNASDLFVLKKEFGNRLYDFSGRNSFTVNKMNYYEWSHFRPNIGDSIFDRIYKESPMLARVSK